MIEEIILFLSGKEEKLINILKDKQYIGITSGASTPSSITNQIYEFISNFDTDNKKTHIKPEINYKNILKEFKK